MPWQKRFFAHRFPLIAIALATLARLLYGVFFTSPLEGAVDSATYQEIAVELTNRGFFVGDIDAVPYMPVGYPLLIAGAYWIVGNQPLFIVVLQTLILGAGIYSSWRLIRRELGAEIAGISTVLLCLSPALLTLPAFLMYESAVFALLAIGIDQVSAAARNRSGQRLLWQVAIAGIALGIATALQVKVLLVIAGVAIWLVVKGRSKRLVATLLLVIVALSFPLLVAQRNAIATGQFTVASNLGANMLIGFNDVATGGYVNDPELPSGCERDAVSESEEDSYLVGCSLRWVGDHPIQSAKLSLLKSLYFWSPMIGPPGDVRWTQDLDYRNALPESVTGHPRFDTFDRAARLGWTLVLMFVVGAGAFMALKINRSGTVLLAIPILGFWLVTLLTFGESRYRLPVSCFYLPFVVVAARTLYSRRFARD